MSIQPYLDSNSVNNKSLNLNCNQLLCETLSVAGQPIQPPVIIIGTTINSNISIASGATNLITIGSTTVTVINDIVTLSGQFALNVTNSTVRVDLDLYGPNPNVNRSGICVGSKDGTGGISFVSSDIFVQGGRLGILLNSCNNEPVVPANNRGIVFNFSIQYQTL